MRIGIIVEGKTEHVIMPHLRAFLQGRLEGGMPKLAAYSCDGRVPTHDKLKQTVQLLLADGCDAVVALTDVYTGSRDFIDAADAKRKMREWVGASETRFHPHAAQHDFEAWLLPYWDRVQKLADSNRTCPSPAPETVNHRNPPADLLREVFRTGTTKPHYVKARDAKRILEGQNLLISAQACPELRAFLNTILRLCGGEEIPER